MITTASGARVPAAMLPEEAADVLWNTVVVGGGPAGAAVAIRLAREGQRVLLVDRQSMPRSKVCGCCLSSTALAELCALGFSPQENGRIAGELPLTRVRVVADAHEVTLPMPWSGTLSREALDTQLVQIARASGARWLPWVDVTGVEEHPGATPRVTLACRRQRGEARGAGFLLQAETVVLATGLSDHVRMPGGTPRVIDRGSRIGAGTTLSPELFDLPVGELLMAVGRGGYCGIVLLEDQRVDVAAAVDRQALAAAGGVAGAVAAILKDAAGGAAWGNRLGEILSRAAFQATPPLTRSAAVVAGATGSILRVGDAAGYVEPFTGEGMGWALAGGRLVADALLTQTSPAEAYRRSYAAFASRHHRRCRRIAAVLRHPRLVASAIRFAAAAPWMARPLVPLLVGSRLGPGTPVA